MTPERYQQIEKIYNAALDLKPDELTPFLEEACAGDDNLLLEVRRLLDANEKVTDFLNNPAAEEAKKIEEPSFIGRQIGRYQLTSEIGSGGMGKVYLARDAKLGRKVAVKILPPESTSQPDMVVRFEQEAIAASSLNHPNIITIHEIGESDGIYFITTEFIEGMTLRKRLEAGKLPIAEAADITMQIAKALEAAHSAGIIHRDIKPENAMIRPDGLVKVLDFGLAKLSATTSPGLIGDSEGLSLKQAKTTPGTILGTVSYMSPEQARGKDLDGRTDIWSLGVVF
ncbi:MAG: serine/threonine protein kinase [Acidobacteria bacterium]|nr:serine/threonine protein kinase [Acidobacteriota bacterium]